MPLQDMEALSADDVCEGEECSLSLRQLRGQQSESPISLHNASNATNASDAAASNVTATASETPENSSSEDAEAESPAAPDTVQIYVPDPSETIEDDGEDDVGETISKVNETLKQNQREEEEGGTCCFSGEDSKDTCGTCYPMSIASYKSKCSKKHFCRILRSAELAFAVKAAM